MGVWKMTKFYENLIEEKSLMELVEEAEREGRSKALVLEGISFDIDDSRCLEIRSVENIDILLTQIRNMNMGLTKLRTILKASDYRRLGGEIEKLKPKEINRFYLWDGKRKGIHVRSLKEMGEVLRDMNPYDERFRFHAINRSKNDFSIWIRNQYGDNELSEQLLKLTEPRLMAEIIYRRVSKHEEEAEKEKRALQEKGYNKINIIERYPQPKLGRLKKLFRISSGIYSGEDLFLVEFTLVNYTDS